LLIEKDVRNFKMILDTEDVGMSAQLLEGEGWEREAPDILDSIIQPDWTVVEMGACLGFYMLLEAKKAARVYAIEADPHNVEIMTMAKDINGLRNIDIFNYAVAAENGRALFYQSPGRSDRGRLSPNGNIEVDAITLDTFAAENDIEQVDLIRCDIEGAEIHMVSGGEKTLAAMPVGSWMFIDLHPLKCGPDKTRLARAIDKILEFGFVPQTILGPDVVGSKSFTETVCRNSGFPKVFLQKCASAT